MAPRYPAIPESSTDTNSLRRADEAMKETLEIMLGTRGDRGLSMVSWQDLVDLGLILPTQIPR